MDYKTARERIAKICSSREYCSEDILVKLKQWGIPESESAQILSFLIEEKYLDNERYTSYYVKDKFRINRWGKIKIRQSLKLKKIPEDLIENSLKQIESEEYYQTCVSLLDPKAKKMGKRITLAEKGKLFRFAAQRGFENEIIYKAIEEIQTRKH